MLNKEEYEKRLAKKGLSGYNVFAPLDIFSFPNFDEEKEKMATDFAEGNEDLKALLLLLWQIGIESNACCAGHDGEFHDTPYIQILLNKPISFEFVKKLSEILDEEFPKNATISYDCESIVGRVPKLAFSYGRPFWKDENRSEICNRFFKILLDEFKCNKNKVISKQDTLLDEMMECVKNQKGEIVVKRFIPKRINLRKGIFDFWLDKEDILKYFPNEKENLENLMNEKIASFKIKKANDC